MRLGKFKQKEVKGRARFSNSNKIVGDLTSDSVVADDAGLEKL